MDFILTILKEIHLLGPWCQNRVTCQGKVAQGETELILTLEIKHLGGYVVPGK